MNRPALTTLAIAHPVDQPVLLCFSHLRWNFVFQRPQHIMSRMARDMTVIFWEEAVEEAIDVPYLRLSRCEKSGVEVVTPVLPAGLGAAAQTGFLGSLLDRHLKTRGQCRTRWYYTPMMLPFSRHVPADAVVFDCMDELSAFRFAPPELIELEGELLASADVVFTGGRSLYEAKASRHPNVHAFSSSVDRAHFAQAKTSEDPDDQRALPRPRLGFYGVIDERMDLDLVAAVADARPDWSIVMVGPVVKVGADDLPQRSNITYLGSKSYEELPDYLGGWDVALMPFAINEATRFISPTKTPEYLAGGVPVVSTPVVDVVHQYSGTAAVRIAEDAEAFVQACEEALALPRGADAAWRGEVAGLLDQTSWDQTVAGMRGLMDGVSRGAPAKSAPVATGHYDYLVVGAGFAGAVLAERLASQHDARVLVIDRRPHVAGNAFDRLDDAGILIHQYGPHIFHTNSDEVFTYLSLFTKWRPYEHRVLADVRGRQVPIPINRTTLNELFDAGLETEADAAAFLAQRAEPVDVIRTSEDVVISAVGEELYRLFFRGYTRKQWGLDPCELDKSVTARVPTRTSDDDRYFSDRHQAMPAKGYTAMFERMLSHPNIDLMLGTDHRDLGDRGTADHLIYTGPIDEYFDYRFGPLPYRSLRFEHRTLNAERHQPVAVVNFPDEAVPYTRVTEYKHLTGQQSPKTSLTYEYPAAEGDPYYPIPRPENQALFKKYEALADATDGVTFVGRLATYRYYNMDQVVGQALSVFRKIDAARRRETALPAAELVAAE